MALNTNTEGLSFSAQGLLDMLKAEVASVNAALTQMKDNSANIDIGQMFDIQMKMNRLAQMSEMTTGVVGASHQALMSMARGVK